MQPALPFEPPEPEPKTFRRRVYRLALQPLGDGSYLFKAKSFTSRIGVSYRCRVNPKTGFVWCSCRDFKFRKDRAWPNYWEGPFCKHLKRAVKTVRKLERAASCRPSGHVETAA